MIPRRRGTLLLLVPLAAALLAPPLALAKKDEPARVVVQHLLIGFKKSVPGKDVQRSRKEAEVLAGELLERARGGEDFEALVREHTDDSFPGIYVLVNAGSPRTSGSFRRADMAARFGDVAFGLAVGEVGLAAHHAALSPYGWHVIKRLE
jgi:hypothetical protein